jgi:hypothetical protein
MNNLKEWWTCSMSCWAVALKLMTILCNSISSLMGMNSYIARMPSDLHLVEKTCHNKRQTKFRLNFKFKTKQVIGLKVRQPFVDTLWQRDHLLLKQLMKWFHFEWSLNHPLSDILFDLMILLWIRLRADSSLVVMNAILPLFEWLCSEWCLL